MGWVKPEDAEKMKQKALAGPGLENPPPETTTPIPMVPPMTPAQGRVLDDEISRSPTATLFKGVIMEAMFKALPPDLRAKVTAYRDAETRRGLEADKQKALPQGEEEKKPA